MQFFVEKLYKNTFHHKYSDLDLDVFNFIADNLNDQVGITKWPKAIADQFGCSEDEAEAYMKKYSEYQDKWWDHMNKLTRSRNK